MAAGSAERKDSEMTTSTHTGLCPDCRMLRHGTTQNKCGSERDCTYRQNLNAELNALGLPAEQFQTNAGHHVRRQQRDKRATLRAHGVNVRR